MQVVDMEMQGVELMYLVEHQFEEPNVVSHGIDNWAAA